MEKRKLQKLRPKICSQKIKGFFGKVTSKVSTITSAIPLPNPITLIKGENDEADDPNSVFKSPFIREEKKYFLRVQKGINNLEKMINDFITLYDIKINALLEFSECAKAFKKLGFDHNTVNLEKDTGVEEHNLDSIHEAKDIRKIEDYREKIDNFTTRIQLELLDEVEKYKTEVQGILQIFERKDRIDKECYDAGKTLQDNDVLNVVTNFEAHLKYEIKEFKEKKQGGLVKIFEKFYKIKYETNLEITKVFDSKL